MYNQDVQKLWEGKGEIDKRFAYSMQDFGTLALAKKCMALFQPQYGRFDEGYFDKTGPQTLVKF